MNTSASTRIIALGFILASLFVVPKPHAGLFPGSRGSRRSPAITEECGREELWSHRRRRQLSMSPVLIKITLVCAYAPLGAAVLTYLAALILKGAGRPALLNWLVKNTSIRHPEVPPGQERSAHSQPGGH